MERGADVALTLTSIIPAYGSFLMAVKGVKKVPKLYKVAKGLKKGVTLFLQNMKLIASFSNFESFRKIFDLLHENVFAKVVSCFVYMI